MRREGSPWQGLGTVFGKELTDHISSVRMLVLQVLVCLIACVIVYFAIDTINQTTAEDPFVLLKLFTESRTTIISLLFILGFMTPLMAIALGFDTVNGEHNRRTLSRILSQPIYRDALLAGKFLAALATIAISLLCLWLLVVGLGIIRLGVPPSGEEVARSLAFMGITLVYAGTWLALAMLLSTVSRSAVTAILAALGLWLFLTFLWPMLAQPLATVIAPPDPRYAMFGLQDPVTVQWVEGLRHLSPNDLFNGAAVALLAPDTRQVSQIIDLNQWQGAILGSPLPLSESLAIASPQAVALIAGVIVLFVATYVAFQRQEVRA